MGMPTKLGDDSQGKALLIATYFKLMQAAAVPGVVPELHGAIPVQSLPTSYTQSCRQLELSA